jgi:hypothetical protein
MKILSLLLFDLCIWSRVSIVDALYNFMTCLKTTYSSKCMLNTPAILQSKIDALNLTQIINEPTRYNPKSVNMGTLIDIIQSKPAL